MESTSLNSLALDQLQIAREAASGRSAHTLLGGSGHALRQVLMALTAGRQLADHENPGEATLQVLLGRIVLRTEDDQIAGTAGDLIVIPPGRHSVAALDDAVILLTVAKST